MRFDRAQQPPPSNSAMATRCQSAQRVYECRNTLPDACRMASTYRRSSGSTGFHALLPFCLGGRERRACLTQSSCSTQSSWSTQWSTNSIAFHNRKRSQSRLVRNECTNFLKQSSASLTPIVSRMVSCMGTMRRKRFDTQNPHGRK